MAIPTRTDTLDTFFAATISDRGRKLVDASIVGVPYFNELYKKEKITTRGGSYIERPIEHGRIPVSGYKRAGTVTAEYTEIATMLKYEWKFLVGGVVRLYADDKRNTGQKAIFDIAKAMVNNLRKSFAENMESYAFSDGTADNSSVPMGLKGIVHSSPSSSYTIGGLNQSTYPWWRNYQQAATGAASVYLTSDMEHFYNTISRGRSVDTPDLIATDQTSYELLFEETLEPMRIINKTQKADVTYESIVWKGKQVIWSPQCTSGYMYFLNRNYIELNVLAGCDFDVTGWERIPGSLDRVLYIVLGCEHLSNNRAAHGVLTGIAA